MPLTDILILVESVRHFDILPSIVAHSLFVNRTLTLGICVRQLKQISRRLVPPPLKYSLEEGHDFERFLQDFETYCDNTYPEVVNTWSRVLGKYLEGSLLDSFNNIDGGRIPYYLVKEKLRKIVHQASRNKDKIAEKYWSAKRERNETIMNFSMRLDRLAEAAGIDTRQELFDEMKKIKILEGLSVESAGKVKFAALSEPRISIDRIIELADNVEMCFISDQSEKKQERKDTTTERKPEREKLQVAVTDKKTDKKCNFCEKRTLESNVTKKQELFLLWQTRTSIKDCRKQMDKARNKEQKLKLDRTEREQTSYSKKLQCPFCSGEHLMKDCVDFKTSNSKPKKGLEEPLFEQAGLKGTKIIPTKMIEDYI
ncbi:hypothetical protein Avbf_12852 [Armadillidium vulgare]|nr:hypothetical protein Avbf_12852 [Armadillidium vulgare]